MKQFELAGGDAGKKHPIFKRFSRNTIRPQQMKRVKYYTTVLSIRKACDFDRILL
ncbi:MAG: hypothetical protein J5878_02850 [Oscillospiraceae bacterium]|nr:hypothetical protein [Oscillospiraceae bacterium]